MNTIPNYLNLAFIAITFITIFIFYKAANFAVRFLVGVFLWMLLQALLGINNFYTGVNQQPQRLALLMAPAMIVILVLFITKKETNLLAVSILKH